MKIIDLLNKIANGEEVPKEIRYNNIDYFWCNQCKIYERLEDDSKDLYNDLDNLNDEVEILEEQKKIPKKMDRELNCVDDTVKGLVASVNEIYKEIADKYNELIDYLKSKGE